MFPKLFNFAVVFFLVIFSIVAGAVLLTGVITLLRPGPGVFAISGGVSVGHLQVALIAVALVAVAIFFFRHRRKD